MGGPIPQIMDERVRPRPVMQILEVCPDQSPGAYLGTYVHRSSMSQCFNLEEIVELVWWTSATADRRVNVDVPVPQIMEKNVEVVENVFQEWAAEWISERICEQIVAVLVPRFRNILWK